MKPDCECPLCELALQDEIESVFMRERQWFGMYQIRSRVRWGFCRWEFFLRVIVMMVVRGTLIETQQEDENDFPRFLLTRLMVRPDRGN